MRYDWHEKITPQPGSRTYFEVIDRRFASAASYLPRDSALWSGLTCRADHGQRQFVTGIDLTEAAAEMTKKRFEQFGIPGAVMQMDAEEMSFADGSFDFIWSWGVIHHSAYTRRLLKAMHRVLRPGGTATVMVYHRNWWNFAVVYGLLKGMGQGQLRKHQSLHGVAQVATDGAIARYYRVNEWRERGSSIQGCR
jgi:SAM-dependent methyltransferase